jgi:hypothetical protein
MNRSNLLGVDRQWETIDGRMSKEVLWNFINWKEVERIVNRLQTRIVKAVKARNTNKTNHCRVLYGTLSMLEPCEVKVSRRVLRGGTAERLFSYPAVRTWRFPKNIGP